MQNCVLPRLRPHDAAQPASKLGAMRVRVCKSQRRFQAVVPSLRSDATVKAAAILELRVAFLGGTKEGVRRIAGPERRVGGGDAVEDAGEIHEGGVELAPEDVEHLVVDHRVVRGPGVEVGGAEEVDDVPGRRAAADGQKLMKEGLQGRFSVVLLKALFASLNKSPG